MGIPPKKALLRHVHGILRDHLVPARQQQQQYDGHDDLLDAGYMAEIQPHSHVSKLVGKE